MKPGSKPGERGFALLLVFLLAAAIALMLYTQMPRIAFESERDKEQLLIDRGEQFKRAIQLYLLTNKRYPARLEDLENTNEKRFLRKRYIDPYTGKNEWRLVHTNGMMLTDSLVQKPPTAGDDKSKDLLASNTPSNATGTANTTGTGADAASDVNATVLQRPSDRTLPIGIPGQGGPPPPPPDPNQPIQQGQSQQAQNMFPPITLGQVGANGQPIGQQGAVQGSYPPGTFPPGVVPPGGLPPGVAPQGAQPGTIQNGVMIPGSIPQVGGQVGTQPQGQSLPPAGGQGQQQGQLQGAGAGAPNTALGLINQLLTTPRNPPPGIVTPASNNTLGAGIAGVASTYTGPAIKSYNSRSHYNEWEFVFQNQQQGVPGQPTQSPTGTPPPTGRPTGGPSGK